MAHEVMMRLERPLGQGLCPETDWMSKIALAKWSEEAHDAPMGEKPSTMDEVAPQPAARVGGGGPLGGVDTPPPDPYAAAGSINTTRSNIKNSAGMAAGPAGDVEKRQGPALASGGSVPDEDEDTDPAPAGSISTTRSNIRSGGSAAVGSPDPVAADGEPIPGIDVRLGKNPAG